MVCVLSDCCTVLYCAVVEFVKFEFNCIKLLTTVYLYVYHSGILAVLDIKHNIDSVRPRVLERVRRIRHRGPDWSGMLCIQ